MRIEQRQWTAVSGWSSLGSGDLGNSAQLVLVFGATTVLRNALLFDDVKRWYPRAHVVGCSTAGEIHSTHVTDDSLVVTALSFEHTQLKPARVKLTGVADSSQAGESLAKAFPLSLPNESGKEEKLSHVLVFSDGLNVNGSDLVQALTTHLPEDVTVTGGMAGDGPRFSETLVFCDSVPENHSVVGFGLYGSRLKVGFGSLGGWDPFGPERLITRSKGNVLYELDGQSALGLYKKYLGEHAKGLPATGLLFPLSVRSSTVGETAVVRAILSIDEKEQSVTFAGDMPEGSYARLMKANFDRLIDGATGAARTCHQAIGFGNADLAILISCIGRKLVLKQRIEEEVESVRDVLGGSTVLAGFYSYGEISPFTPGAKCELHNQTMTITTLTEQPA